MDFGHLADPHKLNVLFEGEHLVSRLGLELGLFYVYEMHA